MSKKDKTYEELQELLREQEALIAKLEEQNQSPESIQRQLAISQAIEDITSSALKMKKSEDIDDVVHIFYKSLADLGIPVEGCSIDFPNLEKKEVEFWLSTGGKKRFRKLHLPYLEHVILDEMFESKKRGKTFSKLLVGKAEKDRFYRHVFRQPDFAGFTEGQKKYIIEGKGYVRSTAIGEYANFSVVNHDTQPFSESEDEIIKKFGEVFNQCYTRFLDLQRAEHQVREAQIETALEKLRAHTMAMKKTSELGEVVVLIGKELRKLGFDSEVDHYSIGITDEDNGNIVLWNARFDGSITQSEFRIDRASVEGITKARSFWENIPPTDRKFHHYISKYEGKAFEAYVAQLLAMQWIDKDQQKKIKTWEEPRIWYEHNAFFNCGSLNYASREKLDKIKLAILKRFAGVFEQTYTRFLDLQKAEEQTREAQIETALEKVRAASMAMHHSDELSKVAMTFMKQLENLDVTQRATVIIEVDKEELAYKMHSALYNLETNQEELNTSDFVKFKDAWFGRKAMDHLQKGETQYCLELKGKNLGEWIDHIGKNVSEDRANILRSLDLKKVFFYGFVFYEWSSVAISSFDTIPEGDISVIKRLTKVFGQSYQRFLDLKKVEAQAREAQIEAALERVRSASLGMQTSDELSDVTWTFMRQMEALEINRGAAMITEVDKENRTYRMFSSMYDLESKQQLLHSSDVLSLDENWFTKAITQKFEQGEEEFHIELKGEQLNTWFEHNRKYVSHERAKSLEEAGFDRIIFNIFVFHDWSTVTLRTLEAMSEEDKSILRRMARVFGQSYKRFLDLRKAEKQAREAQVEASLERIRTHTMAMHDPDDLYKVLEVLFEQFDVLDIKPVTAHMSLIDEDASSFEYRATGPLGTRTVVTQVIHRDQFPTFGAILDLWKNNKPGSLHRAEYKPDVLPEIFKLFNPLFSNASGQVRIKEDSFPDGLFTTEGHFQYGYLGFQHSRKATEEEEMIVSKVALEFARTYRRFLDIKKAKAQAREAEIEAALERIRTHTMAMHQSDQLKEVIRVMFDELKQFDLKVDVCAINLFDDWSKDLNLWIATPEQMYEEEVHLPRFENPIFDSLHQARKKGESFFTKVISKKDKDDFYLGSFEHSEALKRLMSKERLERVLSVGEAMMNAAIFKNTSFVIFNFQDHLYDEEEIALITRFGAVFEQTYTRFLDLQKAEAQAREAEIEVALERVRAKTMAMHQSDELRSVISVVFEQLNELGFDIPACGLIIYDEQDGSNHWLAGFEKEIFPKSYKIQYFDHPYYKAQLKASKDGAKYENFIFEGELKKSYDDHIFTHSEFRDLPDEAKAGILDSDRWVLSNAYFEYGMIESIGDEVLSESEAVILQRFAQVFNQSYTRFLDLERAEVQAKEAQVEAVLERIRARTMAMHDPDELGDLISVVFQQFDVLDINPSTAHLTVIDEDENTFEYWTTGKSGERISTYHTFEIDEYDVFQHNYDTWKQNEPGYVQLNSYPPESLPGLFEVFDPFLQNLSEEARLNIDDFPDGLYTAEGHWEYGYVGFNHVRPPNQEEISLVSRIATEFARSYRRFLDLKNAKAQAREAQIETALERVRSASMAMHKSEDLADIALVMFDQLTSLVDTPINQAWFTIINEEEQNADVWITSRGGDSAHPTSLRLTMDNPQLTMLYEQWKSGVPFLSYHFKGDEIKQWWDTIYTMSKDPMFLVDDYPDHLEHFEASFRYGLVGIGMFEPVGEELQKIVMRFSQVFEQTYTRFLDLQRAEAQTREAQIEAGLERVRASTMAMHKSDELFGVAIILFDQLRELYGLGDNLFRSWVVVTDEETDLHRVWSTDGSGKSLELNAVFPTKEHPVQKRLYKAWKDGEDYGITDFTAQEATEYGEYLARFDGFKDDEELKGISKEYWRTTSTRGSSKKKKGDEEIVSRMIEAFYTHGRIGFLLYQDLVPIDVQILVRFAKVFDQTYTRFLDLQKAEEQAREAQVEAALERVRAASMAMHKSEDLQGVINTAFQQLEVLGINAQSAFIVTDFNEAMDLNLWIATQDSMYAEQMHIPYIDNPIQTGIFVAKKEGQKLLVDQYDNEVLRHHYEHMFAQPDFAHVPEERKEGLYASKSYSRSVGISNNAAIAILNFEHEAFSEDQNRILIRMSDVFDQAYTRFLDLQKAEDQAREAQIEASLEKVRARSMAMHSSDEIADVASVLFAEIKWLSDLDLDRCYICIPNEKEETLTIWYTNEEGKSEGDSWITPKDGHPLAQKIYDSWQNQEVMESPLEKEFLIDWVRYAIAHGFKLQRGGEAPEVMYALGIPFKQGLVSIMSYRLTTDHERIVIGRLARNFQQTYTRFLDLKKAEAQTREAQIEASLEKVRARSMAMHKSDELAEAASVLFREMQDLTGQALFRTSIGIINEDQTQWENWYTNQIGKSIGESWVSRTEGNPTMVELTEKWKAQKPYTLDLKGDELKTWAEYILSEGFIPDQDEILPDRAIFNIVPFKEGVMWVQTETELSEENFSILQRFTTVFQQTYTRFLDLEKAEKQAREAQIETSLEKVRARSMAMHQSHELADVASVLFKELEALSTKEMNRCYITIVNREDSRFDIWHTNVEGESDSSWSTKMDGHPVASQMADIWNNQEFGVIKLPKEEIKDWTRYALSCGFKMERGAVAPELLYLNTSAFNEGLLNTMTYDELDIEEEDLLKRFTRVFQQTHTRFLDLKSAEARAEEAKIEASLERVRSKALAMHRSEELNEVVAVIFEELDTLGFNPDVCGIGIYNKETKASDWWQSVQDQTVLPRSYHMPYLQGKWFRVVYETWRDQRPYFLLELTGKTKEHHEHLIMNHTELKYLPEDVKEQLLGLEKIRAYYISMEHGLIEVGTMEDLNEDEINVLQRFAKVVDLTYQRVEDLRQAEAREKEALQQASLDRIRAEISSMRQTADLERITPLIWKELTTLNIPFLRCGVFIMNEELQQVDVYLANPEGEALTTLTLPFDSADNIKNIVKTWKSGETYTEEWDQDAFISFFTSLMDQGHIIESTFAEDPPERLMLQFYPFKQGMLYIGSSEALSQAESEMVLRMASTFEGAYNRYEDFVLIEAARHRAEATLEELKATQNQLIQAEKMASLGSLTAGIAHEIQNPLNFVNNFSEVSGELLEELKEELDNGHKEDVLELIEDLIQNLEKINHHGGRASSIVKGMLDHSRASSDEKVLTDINSLCDEYLRLSYHGLRAKDRSFNAGYETDFDDNIPKIEVVTQDIGRVVLNLINNAFYAVNERQLEASNGYAPVVKVSTGVNNDEETINITVEDNGLGISPADQDKIFQPFFTTKPTGQGTGLGLSISYDIINAHGGRIVVESELGKGSMFKISLPTN